MKAIETKYIPATDYKGSRIKATDGDYSTTISYPHEYNTEDAHAQAALAHCRKMKWFASEREWGHTHLIGGGTKKGYVFVFARNCENRRDIYRLPEAQS